VTALLAFGNRLTKTSTWLVQYILPTGWFALLTGMFWIGDRALYHKLYYLLLAAPTLLALLGRPRDIKDLFTSPLIAAFFLFGLYTAISLAWSSTDDAFGSLVKRPIYVLFLFFSAALLAQQAPQRLLFSLKASAIFASLAGAAALGFHLYNGGAGRLSGYGALYNPLLSSHVYGFFAALWAGYWFNGKSVFNPLALISLSILAVLLLETGSRTPIMALTTCLLWLVIAHWNRRSLIALAAVAVVGILLINLYPDELTSRGLSSRPEIWGKAWLQILEAPWLGQGYDAPLSIWITAHNYAMADPHNMLLAVLYYGGAVGLALWLSLYAVAFIFAWRNRKEPSVMICSGLLVFGLAASMTEGGAFLSRPKEHWFLIWIPMALLTATWFICRGKEQSRAMEGS